jgi:hypothetical protein
MSKVSSKVKRRLAAAIVVITVSAAAAYAWQAASPRPVVRVGCASENQYGSATAALKVLHANGHPACVKRDCEPGTKCLTALTNNCDEDLVLVSLKTGEGEKNSPAQIFVNNQKTDFTQCPTGWRIPPGTHASFSCVYGCQAAGMVGGKPVSLDVELDISIFR